MATNGEKTDLNSFREQSVFKADRFEGSFFQVHSAVVQNKQLSFRARGILAFALSLPKDWKFSVETFQDSPEGTFALKTAFKELKEAGYLRIKLVYRNGRILGKVWQFFDTPQNQEAQSVENQSTENFEHENQQHENCAPTNNIYKNKTGFINNPTTTTAQACEATPTNNTQEQVVVVVDIWQQLQEHPNRDAIMELYRREKDKIRDEKAWLFAIMKKQKINLLNGKKPTSKPTTQSTPSIAIAERQKTPTDPRIAELLKKGLSPLAALAQIRKEDANQQRTQEQNDGN